MDQHDTERAEHAWLRAQTIYRDLGNTTEADRLDQRISSTKQQAEAAA
jgi:hypothetical protein